MNKHRVSQRQIHTQQAARSSVPVQLRRLALCVGLLSPMLAFAVGDAPVLSPAQYSFSATAVGSTSASHPFTLTNNGGDSLHIIGAQVPGEFPIDSNNCPSDLNVGSSCVFNVAFKPAATGARTGTLTVYTGSGNLVANLSGTGFDPLAPAQFSPMSYDFGVLQIGQSSPAKVFTLSNNGAAPLTVSAATASSNFLIESNSCPGASTTLSSGQSCTFGVDFNPLAAGPLDGTLTVSTSVGDQVADLHGIGVSGIAAVQLSPVNVDFGYVAPASSSANHAFTLTNNSGAALTVSSVSNPGLFPETNDCQTTSLPAGASCTFSVHFSPASLGTSSGTLTVHTTAGDAYAGLRGTGTNDVGDVAPTAISFAPLSGVALNTIVTSNSITVAGINTSIAVMVSGGTYAIDGGPYTDVAGSVYAGDTIRVRQTSSPSSNTTTTATLTIGSGVNAQSADFVVTTLSTDTMPDAFAFGSRSGVAPSSTQTSNAVTPAGFNGATTISVSGGSYAINGGAFTSSAGNFNPGDTVSVRVTASAQFSAAASVQLTIGGVTGSFSVTTIAADTTPDAFTFGSAVDVMPGSEQVSSAATISGLNTNAPISIDSGSYSINGSAFTSAAGSIGNGDTVTVRQTASSNFSTTTTSTLTIGGISAAYRVSTIAAMADAAAFTFGSITGVDPGSVQTSGAITVGGTNTTSAISVSGGSYAVNGGGFTTVAGTVQPGDAVSVRTTASVAFSSTVTVTLTIGATTGTYMVTTLAADTAPDAFGFGSVGGVLPDSLQTSETIVVSGINTASSISISSGQYRIDEGAYTNANGTVTAGSRVTVQKQAPSGFSESAQAMVTIGGVSGSFTVTTTTADSEPDSFTIPTIQDAAPDSSVSSEIVVIGGTNAPTTYLISNGCLQNGDNPSCTTSGILNPGDNFQIVVHSSADYCQSVNGTATIGGVTSTFTVKTSCDLPEVRVKGGGGSLGGSLLLGLGALGLLRGLLKKMHFQAARGASLMLASLLLASTAPAHALDGGQVYGGLRLGSLDSNLGSVLQSGLRHRGYGDIHGSGSDNSFGGTLYVGYAIVSGVDFELGYTHVDDPDARLHGELSSVTDLDQLLGDAGKLASGYGDLYSFAVRLPLAVAPRLSIAPRAGVLLVDSEVHLRAGAQHLDIHDRSGGYVLGSDLLYRVWDGLHVGASINYFQTGRDSHVVEYAALLEWQQ